MWQKFFGFWKAHRKCRCWQKPTLKRHCKQNQTVILTPAWLVFVSSWSVGQWSLTLNMRASFSIQLCIRNDIVFIDFMPLRKRKIMTICSAFLVSVLEISLMWVLYQGNHTGFSTTLEWPLTKPQRTSLLREEFCFISEPSSCPLVKSMVPTLGMWDFLRATWLSPSCRLRRVKLDGIAFHSEELRSIFP